MKCCEYGPRLGRLYGLFLKRVKLIDGYLILFVNLKQLLRVFLPWRHDIQHNDTQINDKSENITFRIITQ
jgi:hypothetical protein